LHSRSLWGMLSIRLQTERQQTGRNRPCSSFPIPFLTRQGFRRRPLRRNFSRPLPRCS